MIRLIQVTIILAAVTFAFILAAGMPSLSRFCEDRKAGKAGTAGNLSELMDQDRLEIGKMLSSLNGTAAPTKGVCQ